MTNESNTTAALRLIDTARNQMMLALSRCGAFDAEDAASDDSARAAARIIAPLDGQGGINVYEARDRVGLVAELLRAALRIEVAEHRIQEAAK